MTTGSSQNFLGSDASSEIYWFKNLNVDGRRWGVWGVSEAHKSKHVCTQSIFMQMACRVHLIKKLFLHVRIRYGWWLPCDQAPSFIHSIGRGGAGHETKDFITIRNSMDGPGGRTVLLPTCCRPLSNLGDSLEDLKGDGGGIALHPATCIPRT